MQARRKRIDVPEGDAAVSSLALIPQGAKALLVLAHGAGADMHHPFMEGISTRLAERGVATLRYQFPYSEQGRNRPDPAKRLQATVRAAVGHARSEYPGLRPFAGGKSLGGRMTSLLAAEDGLETVAGLVFFGFPLHQPGKPDDARAAHLDEVSQPMLFLQGSKDPLAALDRLEPVCQRLGGRARLHVIEGADHSFRVPKKTGRTVAEVLSELADAAAEWMAGLPEA